MDKKAINALEFNKIKEMLKNEVTSSLGKEKIKNINFYKKKDKINHKLSEIEEFRKIFDLYGNIPFGPFYDMETYMKKANIGSYLSIKEILQVKDSLRTSRNFRNYIFDIDNIENDYKITYNLANSLNSLKYLEKKIDKIIVSEDEIADHASSKLNNIRKEIRKGNSAIRSKLDSIINNKSTQKYLQDNVITIRNNRFVVPVKSSYKNKIKGIVHDRSSSGVTLYIEPNSVIKQNNKIKELKIDEKKEIERILYELTADIGKVSNELLRNQDILINIDFILAKTNLSIKMDGVKPLINTDRYINIKNGRHPLIPKDEVVPSNIWLGKDFTSLVITGPNTGGKTVTLKTVGLLTLMTMAGLHIPADLGTEISIFDNVFADIGDEQSIEQSLSTFSSHMTNIVHILKEVTKDSLVLFDELGAGTDPTEGAALATAILKRLYKKDIRTVATTHYNELKEYALLTEGIENASVEFDIETLSPTYKISVGIPGRSNAFDISRKLGLSEKVIDEAQKHIKQENVQFEQILSHIQEDKKDIEKQRDEAIDLRVEIEKMKKSLKKEKKEFKEKKKKIMKDAKREAKYIVKQAQKESKRIIKRLREIQSESDIDNKEIENLKENLNEKSKEYNENIFSKTEDYKKAKDLKSGDKVKIMSLGQEGEVLEVNDDKIRVQAGPLKVSVDNDDLKRIDKITEKNTNENDSYDNKKYNKSTKRVKKEIDIRGKNIEQATYILDEYLDNVYLSSLNEVTIIHGKGTGALRTGVRKYLDNHYHIKKYREGSYDEGGTGVTVVTLK